MLAAYTNITSMTITDDYPLIKLRSLGRNLKENRRKALNDPSMMVLTPTMAIETKTYNQLKPWQKYHMRVAAVAASTTKAVLCGIAAATMLGINHLKPPHHHHTVELCLPNTTSPSSKKLWAPQIRYLYGNLPEEHYEIADDIRTTTIERTYVDLLRLYGARCALIFAEAAMHQKKISKREFVTQVSELGDSRWIRAALALLKKAYDNIQSVYETIARYKLTTANIKQITSIVPQAKLPDPGQIYIPDLLINNWLIVEIDGDSKYENDPLRTLISERRRERELLRRGYGILRFKAKEVEARVVTDVVHYLDNSHRVQALAA